MYVWVEDADRLEIDSKELGIVYKTKQIEEYLNSLSILGLAATKGQGKTFLIKVKRKYAEEKGIICLPNGFIMDTVDSSVQIDASLGKLLNTYNGWVNLWKFSLGSAVLNYILFTAKDSDVDFSSLTPQTRNLLKIKNTGYLPSFYFEYLLKSNITEVKEYLSDTCAILGIISGLRTDIHIYIDKIDQSFSLYLSSLKPKSTISKNLQNPKYWEFAQLALAEAAYDIYSNGSHHIKVNYTIRQEALINIAKINPNKSRNILAYIACLKYTKNDLKGMYSLYISHESDNNLVDFRVKNSLPSQAFLGYEDMAHGYISGENENMFDYIYRHTFKRPYDIMYICSELSRQDCGRQKSLEEIRHLVNNVSKTLLDNYINELKDFLPKNSYNNIYGLIQHIPGNVLDRDIMKEICSSYQSENPKITRHKCTNACNSCDSLYIFAIMYNLGLLGSIGKHDADQYEKIRFENVASRISNLRDYTLPHAKYYVIHPAVHYYSYLQRNAYGREFISNPYIIIGDEYECKNLKNMKKYLCKIKDEFCREKVFVSSTIKDLKNERTTVRKILKDKNLCPIMSEYLGFSIANAHSMHSHDLCIEELLKCKNCLFIIGDTYGGIYAGNNYKSIVNEIIEKSNNTIEKVSVSLMEFYIARSKKINTYVFISQDKLDNKNNLNSDIKKEIDFITHFNEGNWIIGYRNLRDLSNRLNDCRF